MASLRRLLHLTVLASAFAGFLAGFLAMHSSLAVAETATPWQEVVPDLAPDATEVTDDAEIRRILEDLTIFGRYVDGEDWIEYHDRSGRTAYNEKGCTYPGTWWIENGSICYAYPNYRNNAPNCFVMFIRDGGGIQFVAFDAGGAPYLASSSVNIAAGNVAHLPLGNLSPCVGV
jgi:hypothetical protein